MNFVNIMLNSNEHIIIRLLSIIIRLLSNIEHKVFQHDDRKSYDFVCFLIIMLKSHTKHIRFLSMMIEKHEFVGVLIIMLKIPRARERDSERGRETLAPKDCPEAWRMASTASEPLQAGY